MALDDPPPDESPLEGLVPNNPPLPDDPLDDDFSDEDFSDDGLFPEVDAPLPDELLSMPIGRP